MTLARKDPLINERCYHIYSRSIAKYIVFNNSSDFDRMHKLISLYRFKDFCYKYSQFDDFLKLTQTTIINDYKKLNKYLVKIVAYCIMPTHIHFVLKQETDNGITKFVGKVFNGYSKYFNTRHSRIGPLWSSRFKNILIKNDEQMLHLTRYIHLNPSSADFVKNPEDWQYSSYNEYLKNVEPTESICDFKDILDINPSQYKKFVKDRKNYQREISQIKNLIFDNYSG